VAPKGKREGKGGSRAVLATIVRPEPGRLVGYGRVSTEDQELGGQRETLVAAGCSIIFEEKASGGDRERPELYKALDAVGPGDTLVVVKIDRLARSLLHLLEIVEMLGRKGSYFRSLNDTIDTTGPTGKLTLSILGAFAEFERAIGRERTTSGLAYAKSQGRIGGNPGLRSGDKTVIAAIQAKRRQTRLDKLSASADTWLPVVSRLRPKHSWAAVLKQVNQTPGAPAFTESRLKRAVVALVREGLADRTLLDRADRRINPKSTERRRALVSLVAAVIGGKKNATLVEIGHELLRLKEMPPRGGASWPVSTVKSLVDTGKFLGLIP